MGGRGTAAQRERDMRDDSFKNRDRAFIERFRLILIRFVIRFLILFICLFTSSLDSSLISRLKFNEDISSQLIEFVTRKPYSRNILFSLYVGSRNRI